MRCYKIQNSLWIDKSRYRQCKTSSLSLVAQPLESSVRYDRIECLTRRISLFILVHKVHIAISNAVCCYVSFPSATAPISLCKYSYKYNNCNILIINALRTNVTDLLTRVLILKRLMYAIRVIVRI